jgi:hypothetical protein
LAVKAVIQIRKLFKSNLAFSALVRAPTVESVSELVRKENVKDSSIVLLQMGKPGRLPIFLVHPALRTTMSYNLLAGYLQGETVYGVEDAMRDDEKDLHPTIDLMAAAYAESIRLSFPEGPYIV